MIPTRFRAALAVALLLAPPSQAPAAPGDDLATSSSWRADLAWVAEYRASGSEQAAFTRLDSRGLLARVVEEVFAPHLAERVAPHGSCFRDPAPWCGSLRARVEELDGPLATHATTSLPVSGPYDDVQVLEGGRWRPLPAAYMVNVLRRSRLPRWLRGGARRHQGRTYVFTLGDDGAVSPLLRDHSIPADASVEDLEFQVADALARRLAVFAADLGAEDREALEAVFSTPHYSSLGARLLTAYAESLEEPEAPDPYALWAASEDARAAALISEARARADDEWAATTERLCADGDCQPAPLSFCDAYERTDPGGDCPLEFAEASVSLRVAGASWNPDSPDRFVAPRARGRFRVWLADVEFGPPFAQRYEVVAIPRGARVEVRLLEDARKDLLLDPTDEPGVDPRASGRQAERVATFDELWRATPETPRP